MRSRLISGRTAVINQIRGFLLEHGIAVRRCLAFQQAAVQAVSLFNARSRLGVWEFSARLTPKTDYRSVDWDYYAANVEGWMDAYSRGIGQ